MKICSVNLDCETTSLTLRGGVGLTRLERSSCSSVVGNSTSVRPAWRHRWASTRPMPSAAHTSTAENRCRRTHSSRVEAATTRRPEQCSTCAEVCRLEASNTTLPETGGGEGINERPTRLGEALPNGAVPGRTRTGDRTPITIR